MERREWMAFAMGSLAGAGLAYVCINHWRETSRKATLGDAQLSSAMQDLDQQSKNRPGDFLEDEIVKEHLTRNIQFFGRESQLQISKSFVVVVGLGGVGSHLAHLLLRSGVGHLRLVDFDLVSLSSLNRHAVATREDVGIPKTTCLVKHFKRIMPEVELEPLTLMYNDEAEDLVLCGDPDYVIDAIDNTDTKVALLNACCQRNIPVLCIGGAGARADPTRLRFADISESTNDPLCKKIRHRLRANHNIKEGIHVLLSTEKPRCTLVPLDVESGNPLDYQIVPNFRVRTIPVLGTAPAIFGMAAASFVLCHLAGTPFQGEPIFTIQQEKLDVQYDRLLMREELRVGDDSEMFVDIYEATYLIREVWRGVSAHCLGATGNSKDKGLCRSVDHLILTRWDSSNPATLDNLVLLTFEEADKHDEMTLQEVRDADPAFFAYVERVLQDVRSNL